MKTQYLIDKINKRANIKFLMLLLIIVIGYSFHPVFAAGTATPTFLDSLASLLNKAMKIGSWAWIPIATLAGKFMSNDMVYGSWFHFDNYLWQIRNISKNFANFGLLGFLLFKIFQYITKKNNELGKIIGKTVIAGILIQMSWFLVGSIVDISTIATTAIGSFPASFLSTSTAGGAMDTRIEQTIKKGTITLDENAYPSRSEMEIGDDESTAQTKDKFMPKYDSIAGPLVYIGASALGIQDMMTMKSGENQDAKSILITFGLKGLILVFYIIILTLLLVANIIRVGYLWIFIGISPILVLISVFSGAGEGLGKDGFMKQLSLKTLLSMVFKPTLFVGVMGLILVFITSIQSLLIGNSTTDLNGTTITQTANGSKLEINGIASISTTEKILSDVGGTAQNIIPNLIVYFATIFLLRTLVKLSLGGKGDDPITKMVNGGTSFVEDAVKKTQIGGMSYEGMRNESKQVLGATSKALSEEYFGEGTSFNTATGEFTSQKFQDSLNKFTGTTKGWSSSDFSHLEEIAKNNGDFFGETNTLIKKHRGRIGADADAYQSWKKGLDVRLSKTSDKYGITAANVDKLNADDWKIIHEKLGGSDKDIPKDEAAFRAIEYKGTTEK